MAVQKVSVEGKRDERRVKMLAKAFAGKGIRVRREKLSRGSSFRVKSGNCVYSGDDVIFVDKRLSLKQQLAMLLDWVVEKEIHLSDDDIQSLPVTMRSVLNMRSANSSV